MADATMAGPELTTAPGPGHPGTRGRNTGRVLRGVSGVVVVLLIGEAVVRSGLVDRSYLPASSDILRRMAGLSHDTGFLQDVWATLLGWARGLLLAAAIAVPAGLLLGSLPGVNSAVRVLVEFLRPIPGVALIPLAIVLIPEQTRVEQSVAAYAALWPIMINTIYGIGEVDPIARDQARSFGMGRLAIAWRVSLPSVAPFLATGIQVASAIALIVVVSTELVAGGAEHGIGMFIINASNDIDNSDLVYAAVAITGVLGLLLDLAMRFAERRLFRWHFERERAQA